jgi:acetylornithine deacetylase/succinyl-diaminopimelate desuccinylase-like protein
MDKVVEEMLGSFSNAMKGGLKFILSRVKLFKPLLVKLLPKISGYGNALLSTTIAFTMSRGSDAPNVLPGEAYVIANMRFSRHQGSEECFKIL